MFEVGTVYVVRMAENGSIAEHYNWRVLSVDMPIVKFDCGREVRIVNTSSRAFIDAKSQPA